MSQSQGYTPPPKPMATREFVLHLIELSCIAALIVIDMRLFGIL